MPRYTCNKCGLRFVNNDSANRWFESMKDPLSASCCDVCRKQELEDKQRIKQKEDDERKHKEQLELLEKQRQKQKEDDERKHKEQLELLEKQRQKQKEDDERKREAERKEAERKHKEQIELLEKQRQKQKDESEKKLKEKELHLEAFKQMAARANPDDNTMLKAFEMLLNAHGGMNPQQSITDK